jgi:hypothetical protein
MQLRLFIHLVIVNVEVVVSGDILELLFPLDLLLSNAIARGKINFP